MLLFINTKPSLIKENNHNQIQQLDELDVLEQSIDKNLGVDTQIPKDILDSFSIKDTLNPDIWINGKLSEDIRVMLIKIANDFINDLEIPNNVLIKDILFTGSLANFNWSKYSDIDMHIVIDFNQFDTDPSIIEDYFYAQKTIWNQEHDIKVFTYPVELYVQDLNHKMISSAIYSILNNKWIANPNRENFSVDKDAIKTKAKTFIYQVKDIRQDYKDKNYDAVINKVTKIKNKIKQMRNAGLEKGGEFSLENIVFKTLRRIELMDELDNYKAKSYDKSMSIDEDTSQPIWGATLLIKGAEIEDGTQRLYITTVKNILTLDRKKINNEDGQPARMAILGNQMFRVTIQDDKLKAVGVDWKSNHSMLDKLGLDRNSVVINNSKTPLHWETLQVNNINTILNKIPFAIKGIPNIRWTN